VEEGEATVLEIGRSNHHLKQQTLDETHLPTHRHKDGAVKHLVAISLELERWIQRQEKPCTDSPLLEYRHLAKQMPTL
jgi:hypothetical protein